MRTRNIMLVICCVSLEILIGGVALLAMFKVSVFYVLLTCLCVTLLYAICTYQFRKKDRKIKTMCVVGLSVALSLLSMMIACVFTAIDIRMPADNILIAGLKGIVPLFFFAIFFAAPFWMAFAVINFIGLYFVNKDLK